MQDVQDFGPTLRRMRVANGFSLGALAKHLGISLPHLSNVEQGKREPFTDDRIRQIASFLGVQEREMLDAAARTRSVLQLPHDRFTPEQREILHTLARALPSLSEEECRKLKALIEPLVP